MRNAACLRCRARKIKCEGSNPCLPCQKANVQCVSRTLDLSTATRPLLPASPARLPPSNPAILQETSILDLSKSLLDKDVHVPDAALSSAIPGSHACTKLGEQPFAWKKDLPYELPHHTILDHLVRQYFTSVNWFMHVIDKHFFCRTMAECTTLDVVPQSRRNFCYLMSLVWALGAHYLWTDPSAPYDRQFLATLRLEALQYVEYRFLSITSSPDLEAVQVGVLLGSFHLFNGLPNLGFGILGSTIKTAQLLGLHRGFQRSSAPGHDANSCAKVWWALEIFEKYAAIAFGRPCGIDDSDCDVSEIQTTLHDEAELRYHQEKCRLYRIIGPFLGRRKELRSSRSLNNIHTQLRSWFLALPGELKLSPGANASKDPDLVQMQAIALQLAYDNIQIILHRQAVFVTQSSISSSTQKTSSIEQLVESALRTAQAPASNAMIPICRSSHAAMHAAICLFTAGVVLSGLHLGHQAGQHANELLPALESIISFFRVFPGKHYSLVTESLQILQTLRSRCRYPPALHHSAAGSGEMRSGLAESILGSTTWGSDDLSSLMAMDHLTATDLLDYTSGVSLEGVAQSWLWSDPGNLSSTENQENTD